jgi:hypothetical protein
LPACGLKLGATWLFESDADTWAHELGHHRHMEHASAQPGEPTNQAAPGHKPALHDSELNPWYGGDGEGSASPGRGATDGDWKWDRDCLMSYVNTYIGTAGGAQEAQHSCGKCVIRNRGWAVETLANPDGGMVVEGVQISRLTKESVRIKWRTTVAADSTLDYGTTNAYGTQKTDATAVTNHQFDIDNLVPNTEYHFRVVSKTAANETTRSRDFDFTTVAGVVIRNVQVDQLTGTSVRIRWETNINTGGEIRSGEATTYGKRTPQAGAAGKNHAVLVTGLKPGTTYHFQCYSKDNTALEGTSEDATFQTLPVVAITNVAVSEIGQDTAKITWQTDRDSRSYIKWEKDSIFSRKKTVVSGGAVNHEVTLTGLGEGTDYKYWVYAEATDTTENKSDEKAFKTEAKPKKKK